MGGVNEAVAETSAPRLAGIVAKLDRFFPVLWVGLYLLLPVSGWATEMFDSWFDQQRDLEALRALLADGRADAIVDSGVGPAYVGAAALIHDVLGLSPENSLIALTRASYALSIAAGLVLVRVLVARTGPTPPIVSLASQIVLVALVFAAGTWYWSDVPWSHFFAALLAVSIYAIRFAPSRPSVATAAVVGVLLALLAATRSFELVAIVLAWGIAALGLRLLRLSSHAWSASRALAGVAAFVVTTGVVYLLTGKRDLFFLYGSNLDQQAGSVQATEVAQTPTLSLALVPVKLVQLFIDPCYLSLCQVSDYDVEGGRNLDLWSLPLAVQLPALVLLPLCVVARRSGCRASVSAAGTEHRCRSAPTARRDDRRRDRARRGLCRKHPHRAQPPPLRVRPRLHPGGAARRDRGGGTRLVRIVESPRAPTTRRTGVAGDPFRRGVDRGGRRRRRRDDGRALERSPSDRGTPSRRGRVYGALR